jgi:transcriptional regulator with GAF, ATPase, and Fis domain
MSRDFRHLGSNVESLARDSAHSGTPIEQTLAEVTAAAVDLIPTVDAADVLIIDRRRFTSLAPTSLLALELDQAQRTTGQGPCVDAIRDAAVVRCDDLRRDPRWPSFTALAVAAGVRSMMSYQLYASRVGSGALNLFSRRVDGFTAEAEALGAMLATHAAVALTAANRQSHFQSALASRDVIGQAKGMIMERLDVDAVRAFEILARLSRTHNASVQDVAAQIVDAPRGARRDPS